MDGVPVRVKPGLLRVAHPEGDTYRNLNSPQSVIEKLRSWKPRVDLFTFMQPLTLALAMVLTLGTFPCFVDWDDWAVVPVSTYDFWWTAQADESVRNKVRKAEKNGLVVRQVAFDSNFARGIWEIYNELPIRQGRPYSHYGKDQDTVYKELATFSDCSVYLGAYLGQELAGFMKLTLDDSGTQLKTMSLAALSRYRNKAVMNALVAQAVRVSAERNIPYLIYGSYSYGKKSLDGLSEFKRDNGFLRIDLPRYYVPLTSIGSVALKLGLHHPLSYRLPERIFATLRNVRNAYYNHKLEVWNGSSEALSRSLRQGTIQSLPLPMKTENTFTQ
jgi:hypothetical protein